MAIFHEPLQLGVPDFVNIPTKFVWNIHDALKAINLSTVRILEVISDKFDLTAMYTSGNEGHKWII